VLLVFAAVVVLVAQGPVVSELLDDPVVSELLKAAGPASEGAVAVNPAGASPTILALLPVRPEAPMRAPDMMVPELVVPKLGVSAPMVPVPSAPVPSVPPEPKVPNVSPKPVKPVVPVLNVPPRPVVPKVPPRPMVPVLSEAVPAPAAPAWPPPPRARAIEEAPNSKAAAKDKIFKAFMSRSTSLVCRSTSDGIGVCERPTAHHWCVCRPTAAWNAAFRESALKYVNMRAPESYPRPSASADQRR